MQNVTKQVLKKITPKQAERERVEALSRELEHKIAVACQNEGIPAKVRVEGSVAKDTWLSGTPDIDVFMRLPTSIPRKSLGEVGLKIARKAAGNAEQLERFAEHPYLEIFLNGYRVDIVPCYDAKPGEWQSATDRTPYHTDYIKTNLAKELLGEVRLLKKFMDGIGVYGAEIKVGGFSGYLCELLVMKFGGFEGVVGAFAGYNRRVVIDFENVYADRENEAALLFPESLVIVDPVDKGRNVASAVQPQKLYTFIAAARAFKKKPSETYFYPPKTKPFPPETLKTQLATRGSTLVFLEIEGFEAVPDVLWGQLYRSQRALRKLLELNDYKVLKDSVWSNETAKSMFIFELEQQVLANVKKHLGPPLERVAECERFLDKYTGDERVVCGPYVEDGRWIVILPRKNIDAAVLLRERLAGGGRSVGVADLIAGAVGEKPRVLVNAEMLDTYLGDDGFSVFLTEFMLGKPFWLVPQ